MAEAGLSVLPERLPPRKLTPGAGFDVFGFEVLSVLEKRLEAGAAVVVEAEGPNKDAPVLA